MASKILACGVFAALLAAPSFADVDVPTSFDLAATQGTPAPMASNMYWDYRGATDMRVADTAEPGSLEWMNFFSWSTSDDGTDDDTFYRIFLQWGMGHNLEMDLFLPFEFGDGGENSGDVSLGWQWKIMEEADWFPATALYYEIRIPTGYKSSGMDHEVRAIMSKYITPDQWRVHLNPFVRWIDIDDPDRPDDTTGFFSSNDHDARNYEWGIIFGTDYIVSDTMVLTANYNLRSGILNGFGMQHELETAMDFALDNGHTFTVAGLASLDGDSNGPTWGMTLGYSVPLGNIGRFEWGTAEIPYPLYTTE